MTQAHFVSHRPRPVSHRSRPIRGRGEPPGADPAVARWIQRTLVADPPRASSLLVTVWGDAIGPHGGAVWLAGLIRLLAPLGINERLTRTSVFRLARAGWLTATTFGRRSRYALTQDGAVRFDDAYRRIYARPVADWTGEWDVVLVEPRPVRQRAIVRDALAWQGYGEFNATTWLRPVTRDSDDKMQGLIVSASVGGHSLRLRGRVVDLAPDPAAMARRAWQLTSLAADYRRFIRRFGTVIDRFVDDQPHDAAQCFIVRTMLIHAYRRVMLRDPLLPVALLPADWPGAEAYALCRDFYRLTHRTAEQHLTATLAVEGEAWPPADPLFYRRFGGIGHGDRNA